MDNDKKTWDRLEHESERAYEAFRSFLSLPSGQRSVAQAYRIAKNPGARKPSDTWRQWATNFTWDARARAYDEHLEMIRRRGAERAVEQEAQRQSALAERTRAETFEMLDRVHEKAVEFLEEDFDSRGMTWNNVVQITRLHMLALETFGMGREPEDESTWNEADMRDFDEILTEVIEAERSPESLEQGSGEDSEPDYPEEGSEETGSV